MLGLGGGVVVIPGLFILLACFGIPEKYLMHFAIGTSLAIMMCTSAVNAYSHSKRHNVIWPLLKIMLPFAVVGVVAGALLMSIASSRILSLSFGFFLLFVSLDLFFDLSRNILPAHVKIKKGIFRFLGLAVGFFSGLLGIGGGSVYIPIFFYCNIKARKCVGTSAVLILPIAFVGALISAFSMGRVSGVSFSIGFIYLPAFVLVALFSIMGVPIGVRLLSRLSNETVKKVFATFLAIVALNMITWTRF
jgi:uncharacterized membrane protein YfcA